MKKKNFYLLLLLLFINSHSLLIAQIRPKETKSQYQSWFSINGNIYLKNKWSLLTDLHIRRNNFLSDPNFYFLRGGVQYQLTKNLSVAAGYAHLWLASAIPGRKNFTSENRFFEQLQYNSVIGKVNLVQRLRKEQRWQQKVVNDIYTGQLRFTNRVRYLLNITVPVFKQDALPSLVVADELLVHFGKEVVYNTFDQNRIFIGVKQKINAQLSFDIGYMQVYQQKFSGYQYDRSHTFRLFFYYNNLSQLAHK
ncbi:MAG TPA: DUF2490 domain-containing protein [Chitinophagaceae bacterium]|nr:DUF2490 domain-containing protein [Chitinophagaceae bacterium]